MRHKNDVGAVCLIHLAMYTIVADCQKFAGIKNVLVDFAIIM